MVLLLFFYKDGFDIRKPTNADMTLNKDTVPNSVTNKINK